MQCYCECGWNVIEANQIGLYVFTLSRFTSISRSLLSPRSRIIQICLTG